MGLRENQLDHSSAGMRYRTHIRMGAWIEMGKRLPVGLVCHTAPYMGAWIEITMTNASPNHTTSHLMGRVD